MIPQKTTTKFLVINFFIKFYTKTQKHLTRLLE